MTPVPDERETLLRGVLVVPVPRLVLAPEPARLLKPLPERLLEPLLEPPPACGREPVFGTGGW